MSIPPRTNNTLVEGILGRNWDKKTDLTQSGFIPSASMLIDRVERMAAAKGIVLSPTELTILESWVAAHLYAHHDQLYKSKNTQGASATFQAGTDGIGLSSTQYGQTALDLDYSHSLKNLNKQQRAFGMWAGKPVSAQIDYEHRD